MRGVYVNGVLLGSAALTPDLTASATAEVGALRPDEDHVLATSLCPDGLFVPAGTDRSLYPNALN